MTDSHANVIARHDYLPFGEEIIGSNQNPVAGRNGQFGAPDNVNQRFTGQYRDSETGMDFFSARYFSAVQARFSSPDPANAGADIRDPQTWNGYSYVRKNSLALIDPDGMDSCTAQLGDTTGTVNNPPCQYPIQVSCPGCTITVNGGVPDPTDPDPASIPFCLFGCGPTFTAAGIGIGNRNPQPGSTPSNLQLQPPKKGPGVCVSGIGAGLTAGADAGIGLGAGAVGTVSVGAGASGTAGRSPDAGGFLSYGAAATSLRKSAGIPPQNQASPLIFGAAAGAGVGAYVTNASQTSQLGGPFMTFGVDFGYLLNFSAQASFGSDASGHPIFQFSGTVGAGGGAMVYVMTTNTRTAGIKSPCGG